jgi:hypothetical protein
MTASMAALDAISPNRADAVTAQATAPTGMLAVSIAASLASPCHLSPRRESGGTIRRVAPGETR